jgi:hypothetical protein
MQQSPLEIGWAKQHVTPTTFLPATMAFKSSMEVSLFAGISNRVRDLQCGCPQRSHNVR